MPGNHHALKVISSPQTRFHRALNKDQRYYVEFISGPSILSFSFSLISYIPMTRKLNMIPKCIYQSLTSPQRNLGIFLFLPPIHPLLSHLPPIIREWCAKSLPISLLFHPCHHGHSLSYHQNSPKFLKVSQMIILFYTLYFNSLFIKQLE